MGSDIDQRSAALFFLVDKNTPGGNGPSADSMGFRIINITQIAICAGTFQVLGIRPVTVLVANGEDFPVSLAVSTISLASA